MSDVHNLVLAGNFGCKDENLICLWLNFGATFKSKISLGTILLSKEDKMVLLRSSWTNFPA